MQSATPVQSGEKLDGTTERELEELEEEDAPQKEILWCRHPKRGLQISRVHTLVSLQSAFLLHRGAKLDTVREEESDGENCDNENELRELGTKLCEDTTDGNEAMEWKENEEEEEEEEEQKPKSVLRQPLNGMQLSTVQTLPSLQSACVLQVEEELNLAEDEEEQEPKLK
ncbi:hypothetical protein COU76_05365 [Candidatus Peregrinibacteria bacterium CG10_big_fil_rev_8_21_14_0_10_49_10]|nr:MAG: hypothetical protein COU76_05365 [Candidatus Peregrinibacteria bacterium CG10_big_fil_rev_8_21_14_0_10_49_10]